MGIRAKLILSTCIPLLLIYVAVLGWDYLKSRKQAVQMIEQLVAQRASADASQVNTRLTTVQQSVDRVGYFLANRANPILNITGPNGVNAAGGAGASLGGLLGGGLRQTPWIDAMWVQTAGEPGRNLFGIRRTTHDRRPFEDFKPDPTNASAITARAIKEGKPIWIEPAAAGDLGNGSVCVFASPFYAPEDGRYLGVVCASIPTDALRFLRQDTPVQLQIRRMLYGPTPATTRAVSDEAAEPKELAAGGYLLIDRHGNILSRPDGKAVGQPLAVGPDDDELQRGIDRALKGSGEIVSAGGLNQTLGATAPQSRYVLAMEPLSSTGWLYVTAAPESDLLGPVQERLISRAFFLTGSLALVVGVLSVVITRFCRPIERMAETVQQLARGDLDAPPVPVLARDELGQLASGFNDMTGRLRHHVRELTEQSAEREKVESELRIARQIQSDLLPRTFPPFPHRNEFSLHAVNIPARHIAGDFFDFFFTGDRLTVVIADVSGKGVPAALMMAVTRTMVRNLAESGLSPSEIVERVNRMLVEDTTPGLFVTMILGQYDPATGEFVYVNAGHPPIVSVASGQAEMCCEATSPLLGVVADDSLGTYRQQSFTLEPGAAILLYTDGVTEAHDQTNVMFGEDRLLACARAVSDRDTPDLCEGVVGAVMAYQHQSAADDLTLVCLRNTTDKRSV